jgi:dTMP kinase
MDLSVEQASARGGFGGERYENAEFQAKVRENFSILKKQAEALSPHLWKNVDAAGTIEEVHERIAPLVGGAAARLLGHGAKGLNVWSAGAVVESASSEPAPIRRLWDGEILTE